MVNLNQKDGVEMSKPIWFVCKDCLFFKYESYERIGDREEVLSEDIGFCFFNNLHQLKTHKSFCSNWTCKNCFSKWDEWNWDKDIDKELRIDHNKCEKVEFK
jgi:hypothetical protein